MNFIDAVKAFLGRYFDFKGRSSRSEYWYAMLFIVILAFITIFIDKAVWGADGIEPLSFITQLVLAIPSVALGIRRLHDIDRKGWWYLLWFIPILGWAVLIYWACKKGDDGYNRFGPNPLA